MPQHPEKRKWKESHPHGLSASQFGMALGFCGRVSDYVNYLRDIVGTEQEFQGNACTAHGIHTEPKSRALYELLTGCRVHDGGFFVTSDRVLGCSPDGQIFYCVDEQPLEHQGALAASSTTASLSASGVTCLHQGGSEDGDGSSDAGVAERQRRSGGLSVRVPFKSKRRPRSPRTTIPGRSLRTSGAFVWEGDGCKGDRHPGSTTEQSATAQPDGCARADQKLCASAVPPSRRKLRLLEIKSPFRALYDSSKTSYQPFGIPMHYMCQIQGQLAIADCEECDFFVYLDQPMCQVEGWRVRRSRAFWAWAEPNLRCVCRWVRDGPPDWLNRLFAFTNFDFGSIEVVPLIFPFDITANAALTDARRFAFFARFPNPFEALDGHRRSRDGDGTPAPTQDWRFPYIESTWADLTEWERIAVAAQAPAVQCLFAPVLAGTDDMDTLKAEVELWSRLSSWRQVLEMEGVFEESATAVFWKEWTRTAAADRDPVVKVRLSVPDDWDTGRVVVRCSLPSLPRHKGGAIEPLHDTAAVRFHRRLFFASLSNDSPTDHRERATSVTSVDAARLPAYATPLDVLPLFSVPATLLPKGVKSARQVRSPAAISVQVSRAASSSESMATPSRRGVSTCAATSSSGVRLSTRDLSPSPQRVVAASSPLSHECKLPRQLSLPRQEHQHDPLASRFPDNVPPYLADASAATRRASSEPCESVSGLVGATPPASLSSPYPPLLCEITTQDLLDIICFAEDCEGVVIVFSPPAPLRCYEKQRNVRNLAMRGFTAGPRKPAGSTLLVGESAVVQQLLHMSVKAPLGRASRTHPIQCVMDQLGMHVSAGASLVPCFVGSPRSSSSNVRDTMQHLGGIPCFLVRAETSATTVLEATMDLMREWKRDA
ncbi:hypothetical protein LSCM1_01798 [Leishmania martiniquensis]|uniref:YqaJ viral recombinase domain-containing protein n=1 Tax=Leishmania martiniquensis TaxID=1580590 RepID=A0A836KBR6_9TRYP|nr:hypothetical protein LSCM1_01798 [Leishmania martiniquensis]